MARSPYGRDRARPARPSATGGTRTHLLARLALALAAGACADEPTTNVVGPQPDESVRAADDIVPTAAAAASASVPVQVPPSMRRAPLDVPRSLVVPSGFAVQAFARVRGARFLAVAPNGDLLVSVPSAGKVVLVRREAAGADPRVSDWATGLYRPHDIVFHRLGAQTWVYVAEGDRIARYAYTTGDAVGRGRQVVLAGLPTVSLPELKGIHKHELKNVALHGSTLYVSIASSCNACESDTQSDPVRNAIYVHPADGGPGRLFARGLRNAEGLAFVPGTATLWVVVNNRDNIAYPYHRDFDGDGADDYGRVMTRYVDDHPPELFTRVRDGGNYGWPFCNSNPDTPSGLVDMPFDRDVQLNADGGRLDCARADRPSRGIQAHSAPLGLTFLQGTAAPAAYREGAVVALHGSWNRSARTGYKVVHFAWDPAAGRPAAQVDLIRGWLGGSGAWGRPVDVAVAPDGALYVSDDNGGVIYRLAPAAAPLPPAGPTTLVGAGSRRCLDVPRSARTRGTQLIVYDCHGGENQRWTLPASGRSGPVTVFGTYCLDASSGLGRDGDPIVLWSCHGGVHQQWTLTVAGELRGIAGKCVAVSGALTANRSPLVLAPCSGGASRRWGVRS